MLIDTHCHLTDERLLPEVSEVIASAARAGVERLVTVGYDRESSLAGAALADEHASVWCALGVHPHDASSWTEETGAEFARIAAENAKVVAIGEIGLDYHYDLSPREVQREVFARQLALADECGLPAALHVREAYGDCLAVLKENSSLLGHGVLLHCWSGSPESVREFSAFGAYFAFGGSLTFKGAHKGAESLALVPRDRLLLETDAPYLTPVPFRGRVNRPEYVAYVAGKVAEVLGISREEVEEITTENAKRLFKRMK